MKKIININLSGRVIPIEDSAYEKLQGYIESLRRYFAHEDGRDEIINDIESRIAELMNEKIRKGAFAVTDADVDEIIASMGRVEDFEAADKENAEESKAGSSSAQTGSSASYSYEQKKSSRLYRDTSDKFIGGVCSGIAAYLNVDPAIVRILFAIITFGGFGFGFLAYIILWIVLPPKNLEGFVGKRLYRNPDDKMLGGVAGGLAAYFGKNSNTIRLIFAAPLILNILFSIIRSASWDYETRLFWDIGFGSFTGMFILAYIILWIVLPEAITSFQKMEMRGETVDVNSIRQNVREGMDNMKDRVKEWGEEVKEAAQNFSNKAKEFANTKGKTVGAEIGESARSAGYGIGHAFGVIFKVFFLFIFGAIAFAIFVSLISLLFSGAIWWPINNFLWTSATQKWLAWLTLILFFVVPLIGFITWLIRRIMRVKSRNNYLGWTFGGLWTLGWVAATFFGISLGRDFRKEVSKDQEISIAQPRQGKMLVTVSKPELEFTGNYSWVEFGSGWDMSSDTLKIAAVRFVINKSTDDSFHVKIWKNSFGKTYADADERAARIQYEVISRDSLLDLDNGFSVDRGSKYRGQNVEIEILVPVGKKIRFDHTVTDKLNFFRIRAYRNARGNRVKDWDIDNDNFEYATDVDYVMGEDGRLVNPDAPAVSKPATNGTYRYNSETKQEEATDMEKEQEQKVIEKQREAQEAERKLQEIRDRKKADSLNKRTSATEDINKNSNDLVMMPVTKLFFDL